MVTMSDVASRANVSRATVSLVLNERHESVGIAEETRLRVLQVAKEMGYRRNRLESAMRTKKYPVMGFLAHHLTREFVSTILAGALAEAEQFDYFLKVLPLHNRHNLDSQTVERCLELRLAGLIVVSLNNEMLDHLRQEVSQHGIPISIADTWGHARGLWSVNTDHEKGLHLAVEHLFRLGHRRIAYIGNSARPDDPIYARDEDHFPRYIHAFRKAMTAFGLSIPDGYICDRHFRISEAPAIIDSLYNHPGGRPTAIIGMTDSDAACAVNAAFRMGWRVPDELSVIGYGNVPLAEHCICPLTNVALPFYEQGQGAVRRLVKHLENPHPPFPPVGGEDKIAPQLIVRESTAQAPRS